MDYWDNFVKNIKYLRKLNGYTQEQVAQKMGITRGNYQYIEAQKYEPTFINTIFQICNVYNVTPNDLLLGDIQFNDEFTKLVEQNENFKRLTEELEELKIKLRAFEEKLKDYDV